VEEVGFYNPLTKEKVLRNERIKHWMSMGAKPSDTVFNLLISEKIIEGKKIDVYKKSKKTVEPTPETPVPIAPLPEKPAETPAEQKPIEEKPIEEPKKEEPKKEEPKKEAPVSETPKE